MNNRLKRTIIELLIFIAAIILDRVTKIWAVNNLKDNVSIPIINGVLEFYYLPNGNTGAAFGMLKGHQSLFLIIALVVVVAIGYILVNMPFDKKYRFVSIFLLFIAAGGVGNMIDRFIQNYVVDFIYISCINFPIFNVADIFVSVSTTLLIIIGLIKLKEEDFTIIENALKNPFCKHNK